MALVLVILLVVFTIVFIFMGRGANTLNSFTGAAGISALMGLWGLIRRLQEKQSLPLDDCFVALEWSARGKSEPGGNTNRRKSFHIAFFVGYWGCAAYGIAA